LLVWSGFDIAQQFGDLLNALNKRLHLLERGIAALGAAPLAMRLMPRKRTRPEAGRSAGTNCAQDWRVGSQMFAGEMAMGSAGTQALAGLAAVILGILAVVGTYPGYLTLIALLVVGATVVLTGSALSGAALSFMRPSIERTRSPMAGGSTVTTTGGI